MPGNRLTATGALTPTAKSFIFKAMAQIDAARQYIENCKKHRQQPERKQPKNALYETQGCQIYTDTLDMTETFEDLDY
jgi:hypothetical protein